MYFPEKINTTGILFVHAYNDLVGPSLWKTYRSGFEMPTMEGKLCLPSEWYPRLTAKISAN